MGTAALLNTDRWDEVLLQNITANFRTTGKHGFRGSALSSRQLCERRLAEILDARPHELRPAL